MNRIANKDIHSTITTHYIDGAFVESHGREVRASQDGRRRRTFLRVLKATQIKRAFEQSYGSGLSWLAASVP
jgi:hypothetical protein